MLDPDILRHYCRADHHCASRVWDPEYKWWTGAPTMLADSLCSRCVRRVELAAGDLWTDYLALRRLVVEPSAPMVGEIHSGAPDSKVPVNVHADALCTDIASTMHRCAEVVADRMNTNAAPEGDVASNLTLVETNIDVLLSVPAHDAMQWNQAGDDWVSVRGDGVDLALRLVELHRQARAAIGVDRSYERMPLPCPKCESHRLVRYDGTDTVTCRACGYSATSDGYHQLTHVAVQAARKAGAR